MKRLFSSFSLVFLALVLMNATLRDGGYKVGDTAQDFSLKNIDGKMLSLANMPDAKGFVVIFTCNHCPYAKMYEDRIIETHQKFAAKGYPVIAINPNDPKKQAEDSFENMQKRAKEKNYPFPYLFDQTQETARIYGATKTPHVFVLTKVGKDLKVSYIGTLDDNAQDATAVKKKYLEEAINALISDRKPDPNTTKAVGCTIKWKDA